MTRAFADSYAFVAAMNGSPRYKDMDEVVTGLPQLTEVAQAVMKRLGPDVLRDALSPVAACCIDPAPADRAKIAADAAKFRAARNEAGAKCSSTDAWGYAMAQHLGIPFLTGDEDFRGVPGVKFVKE